MFKKPSIPTIILVSGVLILAVPGVLMVGTYYIGKTVIKTGVKGTGRVIGHISREEL